MNTIQVVPLKIRNLSKNLLYLGQVYADPRDALNEFVSNAADECVQAGRQGEVIRVYLGRKGERPWIRVLDRGQGMSRRQLERVATSLCESEKANIREIPEVIGEKGIGILGFASIAEQCDLVSRVEGSDETHCMSLKKGKESCTIRLEETRKRAEAGTDVYLYGISKENLRILTPQKLCEYFRIRRRSALLRGDYAIEIVEGRKTYPVQPETYKGIPFEVSAGHTSFGKIRFHLYLWPTPAQGRHVAVIGKGGTTILDSLDELDEFRSSPWNMNQIQGDITFAALEQTTGRKGVVRDEARFPAFVEAVRAIESNLVAELHQLTEEHQEKIDRHLYATLREVFAKVLKELEDLEMPLRTGVEDPEGKPGPGAAVDPMDKVPGGIRAGSVQPSGRPTSQAVDPSQPQTTRQRSRPLPTWYPKPFEDSKSHLRSELDPDQRVIYVNERHPDYAANKRSSQGLMVYLTLLTAKELALWHFPRMDSVAVGEEMICIFLRARKYLPDSLTT